MHLFVSTKSKQSPLGSSKEESQYLYLNYFKALNVYIAGAELKVQELDTEILPQAPRSFSVAASIVEALSISEFLRNKSLVVSETIRWLVNASFCFNKLKAIATW